MNDAAAITADANDAPPKKLDDVMLAMDIVDTLRHRERLIDRELSTEAREEKLIGRLKEIYAAQGIDVPDRILADGVKALEEKRFHYEPPKGGLGVALAKFYIGRNRWLPPVAAIFGLAAFATAIWEFGFEAPHEARVEAARVEITETLPNALEAERDAALEIAATDYAKARIETAYQDGVFAAENENADGLRANIQDLETLRATLAKQLDIRVVSRPGEYSGVFRVHDDDASLRNYYLIVEAVDARGRKHELEITSEEDRATRRVANWGVRVPEGVFNRIAADKQDDQIIQDALTGEKPTGALLPTYSIETAGGAILEW
ncbi:MAG: DUF6384 family protein [Pseudomonadota bacterium]